MYVIVARNSASEQQVFGTTTGKPFNSVTSAAAYARRMRQIYGHLEIIVFPISELPYNRETKRWRSM